MSESRRTFLGAAAAFAAVSAWGAVSLAAQAQGPAGAAQFPITSIPSQTGGPIFERRVTPAERMQMNQVQIRKSSARLAEVVGELQKDLEANDTTNVLSLGVIRKAEEIEKLARQIKSLVRG